MSKIQFFTFDNFNAPTLENDYGSILNILDKCLIDGFSFVPVVAINVTDGVATITFAYAHKYMQFQWLSLAGFNHTKLNNEHRILSTTTNTVAILIDIPNGNYYASGASVKLAPLGWTKPYSTTGKAVYRAGNTEKNPFYLRIDASIDPAWTSSYAKFAKVGILETCAGIDDLTGIQAPFVGSDPLKNWVAVGTGSSVRNGWSKWYTAISEAYTTIGGYYEFTSPVNGSRKWALVGNDSGFYFIPYQTVADFYATVYGFDVAEKNGVYIPLLFTSLRDVSASSELISISPITDTGNVSIVASRNVKGDLVGSFGKVFVEFNQRYSGYTNIVTRDDADGLLLSQYKVSDASGYFAGVLKIPYSVLYKVDSGALQSILQDNGSAFLLCRTSSGSGLKGAVAFYLGESSL